MDLGMGDILFLSVVFRGYPRLLVTNIYNAPPGAIDPGAGVARLTVLADAHLPPKTIVAGDFNLHHLMWRPSYLGPPSTQAESLIRWLESKDLSLISKIDKPTHTRGNVPDLCFGICQFVANGTSGVAQQELDVISDYTPLLVSAACGPRGTSPTIALRFATIDKDNFLALLRMQLEGMLKLSDKSAASLDTRDDDIIHILSRSFSDSAKRALPHNKRQPWWN
ncbi:hypothetical protein K3495_g10675 [Podosphaera aphanis]|nr:hypothetical protein K3495_g10675 [Podosphaera aphanis]